MHRATVLLVSDDAQSGRVWEFALGQLELDVVFFTSPEEAIEWRSKNVSEIVVIDETTDDFDGIALIRRWRPEIAAPILLLTGGNYTRSLDAYRAGADECCVQPLSPALFLAKIRAWLRHSSTIPMTLLSSIERGPFQLYPMTHEVVAYDQRITLTNLEFRLLHLLMTHANMVIASEVIIDRVWHYSPGIEGATLKNAIYRLRRKIESDPTVPQHIIFVSGQGYLFKI